MQIDDKNNPLLTHCNAFICCIGVIDRFCSLVTWQTGVWKRHTIDKAKSFVNCVEYSGILTVQPTCVRCVALVENQEFPEIPIHRVYNNLQPVNKFRAPGPDGLSNWVLKEYAEFLVQLVVTFWMPRIKNKMCLQYGSSPTLLPSQKPITPQERTPSNFPDSRALKDRRGLHFFWLYQTSIEGKGGCEPVWYYYWLFHCYGSHKHGVQMAWGDWWQLFGCFS